MPTVEELKHKIATADDLKSVVKTMKALAAVSIHQYEQAVESLIEYDRTLEMGWQILLQKHPQELLRESIHPPENIGIVVFGSDWGMCGQFNERIAEYTQKYLKALSIQDGNVAIVNVGGKIGDRLKATGYDCEASFNLPSSVAGIAGIIQELVLTLETWRKQQRVEQIVIIYNRIISGTVYRPTRVQIFPLNLKWLQELKHRQWNSSSLPTFTMEEDKLAAALFRQYFFVSLYRACAESLKSENTSRLAAMQMAEKNISERLGELNLEFNQQRQTSITEELLDIIAGFEALNG
ncbi:F0F1 ATP synthase subunit gamma [Pleurocapsales cyanobacterium LEGE 10410]|nr:F0F1 ATP synthase subunit gamma [Pleurocapsales cyanobacterium LEGE 10410]